MQLFACPSCRTPLQFPPQMIGKTVGCPRCGESVVIGAAATAPPAAAAPVAPPRRAPAAPGAPKRSPQPARSRSSTPPPRRVPAWALGAIAAVALLGAVFLVLVLT